MPTIVLNNIGALGIIKDIPDFELPPEAWSNGENVRFRDGQVEKFKGHTQVFGTPSGAPNWAMSVPGAATQYWLYSDLTKLYSYNGAAHSDVTRSVGGDYSSTLENLWSGGLLHGIPVTTNGIDVPQAWATLGSPLIDLPNWPAADRCLSIKPFKGFLVAMNITRSGSNLPHRVKWSHLADPGTLPTSWDETDPTKDAGEFDLTDTGAGLIRDGLQLGDIFVIYKDFSTWGMQHVPGSIFIFRIFQIFTSIGILSKDCVSAMPIGRSHFLATSDDLLVHEGTRPQSVLDRKWRRFLSNSLDGANFDKAFTQINPATNEAMFCYPESGATNTTLAIVWNFRDNTIGHRKLDNIPFIALGSISDVEDASWSGDSSSWDSDMTVWDEGQFSPSKRELLICDSGAAKFFQFDQTEQFNSVNINSFVERTGLAMVGQDREGNITVDLERRKLAKRIWPKVQGGPIDVRVGAQEEIGGPIVWGPTQSFNPLTQRYLDYTVAGRLIAVRFQSQADVSWKLLGYDLEIELLGVH